jgi:hypothetical protein
MTTSQSPGPDTPEPEKEPQDTTSSEPSSGDDQDDVDEYADDDLRYQVPAEEA